MRWLLRESAYASAAGRRGSSSFLLAFLAADILAFITNAFAFVGLRGTIAANFRCDLADKLLVDTGDCQHGRLLSRDGDARRDRIGDVVAEAKLKIQILALNRGPIAHALYLKLGGETLCDAENEIVHQRTRKPPHGRRALHVL